jgi:hypothetical protein
MARSFLFALGSKRWFEELSKRGRTAIGDARPIGMKAPRWGDREESNGREGLRRRRNDPRAHGILPDNLADNAGSLGVIVGRTGMISALNCKRASNCRQRVLSPMQRRHPQQLELSQQQTPDEGGSTEPMS